MTSLRTTASTAPITAPTPATAPAVRTTARLTPRRDVGSAISSRAATFCASSASWTTRSMVSSATPPRASRGGRAGRCGARSRRPCGFSPRGFLSGAYPSPRTGKRGRSGRVGGHPEVVERREDLARARRDQGGRGSSHGRGATRFRPRARGSPPWRLRRAGAAGGVATCPRSARRSSRSSPRAATPGRRPEAAAQAARSRSASFSRARASRSSAWRSIWRTRSRVIPSLRPTSCSVSGWLSPSP